MFWFPFQDLKFEIIYYRFVDDWIEFPYRNIEIFTYFIHMSVRATIALIFISECGVWLRRLPNNGTNTFAVDSFSRQSFPRVATATAFTVALTLPFHRLSATRMVISIDSQVLFSNFKFTVLVRYLFCYLILWTLSLLLMNYSCIYFNPLRKKTAKYPLKSRVTDYRQCLFDSTFQIVRRQPLFYCTR